MWRCREDLCCCLRIPKFSEFLIWMNFFIEFLKSMAWVSVLGRNILIHQTNSWLVRWAKPWKDAKPRSMLRAIGKNDHKWLSHSYNYSDKWCLNNAMITCIHMWYFPFYFKLLWCRNATRKWWDFNEWSKCDDGIPE